MTGKIIPLTEWKRGNSAPHSPPSLQVLDTRARPLQDLRISLTDRCNFRCVYCMPKASFGKDYPFLPRTELLSFEEIQRLAKSFVGLGVRKIRLTGGEPLLRKGVEKLIEMLAQLETPNGKPLDLTMTTNGALLAERAQTLKDAGLRRITVSLDALDDATFRRMSDADFPVGDVLRGLDAAHRAGLTPIKVNMVVKQGWNEHAILPMARYFKDSPSRPAFDRRKTLHLLIRQPRLRFAFIAAQRRRRCGIGKRHRFALASAQRLPVGIAPPAEFRTIR